MPTLLTTCYLLLTTYLPPSFRISIVVISFFVFVLALLARLFYWQIIKGDYLAVRAAQQRESVVELSPTRGAIFTSDGFPLVINQEGFLLYANPQELETPVKSLVELLTPILAPGLDQVKVATDASQEEKEQIRDELIRDTQANLTNQLSQQDLVWVLLKRKLPQLKKTMVEDLNIAGLGFNPEPIRAFTEASMAAHVLGFVGQDDHGKDRGYFGLEGFYDLELSGRMGVIKQEKDALNRPIPIGKYWDQEKRDGRHLQLYLDRSMQFLVENELKEGVKRFGAKSGSVVIMDPKTGGILTMASWPSFEPAKYRKYDQEQYVNPVVSKVYEPGSTFKILTLAAGLNEDLIEPSTVCDMCDGHYKINQYYIRTWNDKYYKNSTMTEALAHSDNIGMVFVAKKLGVDTFVRYLKDFGIGMPTGIDLQGESVTPLREEWKEVDLYTASFGQGLAVNAMQMVTVAGAIANEGKLMQPRMVRKIIESGREIDITPRVVREVIKPETAETLTNKMVAAVEDGDAKWAKPKGYRIAGKTGTAQIALAGHYDEEKTIASFVGFAPADDPAFVMLTIIEEPTSSPWGSETAAPLFFDIAKKLFVYLGIPPTEGSE